MTATPFEPFFIVLADGRELNVTRPELVWMPVAGLLWFFRDDADASQSINPGTIVNVESRKGLKDL